ncbi:MAG TPA: hypothetical protein VHZ95_07690, partial [Polyangiales bacterium]|nr:hypothetical protein [Polyangiales bacterium]
ATLGCDLHARDGVPMGLIDVERAVLSICFRAEPPEQLLAALGDRSTWLMYREMVRDRLLHEIRVALPRSCRLLGERALLTAFDDHLDRDPPRTRFFRAIVRSFVDSALPLWAADAHVSPRSLDMVRYETALWEVRDLESNDGAYDEFAFDRAPVVSSALRLLELAHAVHLTPGDEPGPHYLCIHRASDADRPRTWSLTKTTFALLQRWQVGDATVAESVQQFGAARGIAIDAAFVDALCATLAQFIETGIVLGSR